MNATVGAYVATRMARTMPPLVQLGAAITVGTIAQAVVTNAMLGAAIQSIAAPSLSGSPWSIPAGPPPPSSPDYGGGI